jgi:hypothetical protein
MLRTSARNYFFSKNSADFAKINFREFITEKSIYQHEENSLGTDTSAHASIHRKKKIFDILVPSRDVTYQTLTSLFSPRESLVSDIPAGDGISKAFFTVYLFPRPAFYANQNTLRGKPKALPLATIHACRREGARRARKDDK